MIDEARHIVGAFHDALASEDWSALRRLLADDARWFMPGENAISGQADTAELVVAKARQIASFEMRFEVRSVVVGRRAVALLQHNTAGEAPHEFAQDVATVLRISDGRIAEIETLVSDPDGFDEFFCR